MLYNVNHADGIRKQTVYAPRELGQGTLGLPQANSSLFERVTFVYVGRWHGKSVMTCILVLSGRVELMVMHGGVKNNYEHNVVVMNLPLCPQTADDVNVNELQISNIQKLMTAYFLSASQFL